MRWLILPLIWQGIWAREALFPHENWESGLIDLGNGGDDYFYILIKARNRKPTAPLLLYLCGGPGISSLFSLFLQNGPYLMNNHSELEYNTFSWNNDTDILYVDQPKGVGFSGLKDEDSYCSTKACVAKHLHIFLHKFFMSHAEYNDRPFYIAGVSYAGHYVLAITAYLLRVPNVHIAGVILVSPWLDALKFLALDAAYLYEHSKFSMYQVLHHASAVLLCRLATLTDPESGYRLCRDVENAQDDDSNLTNVFNIRLNRTYRAELSGITALLNQANIKAVLGVGTRTFKIINQTAAEHLRYEDYYDDYLEEVRAVLDSHIPTLVMYGELDYACQYKGGFNSLAHTPWRHQTEFNAAPWRSVTLNGPRIDGEDDGTSGPPFGRKKAFENLELYYVFNAGHLIELDQPLFAYRVLQDFLNHTLPF